MTTAFAVNEIPGCFTARDVSQSEPLEFSNFISLTTFFVGKTRFLCKKKFERKFTDNHSFFLFNMKFGLEI